MTAARDQPRPRGTRLDALRFDGDALWAIDQTALPWQERELELRDAAEVAAAIRRLSIRGAPLIGVAAAYGVALELLREPTEEALQRACHLLASARPTAVNLSHAIDRVRKSVLADGDRDPPRAALSRALAIHAEEEGASEAIGVHGAELLTGTRTVLTHCNTGALAAPGRGTALAVVAELWERGQLERVIVTESRPLLQGARLTTFELGRLGLPHELVVDAAAPAVICSGGVDAVVVGCDRIAANGDVANKVGTYALALAARATETPFIVAGPVSTIDPACPTGEEIVIEERDPEEVRTAGGRRLTPGDTPCRNPAFDRTPAALITAVVTEQGVAQPVDGEALRGLIDPV